MEESPHIQSFTLLRYRIAVGFLAQSIILNVQIEVFLVVSILFISFSFFHQKLPRFDPLSPEQGMMR